MLDEHDPGWMQPQFIVKDFKHFIRLCEVKHVRKQSILSAEQR